MIRLTSRFWVDAYLARLRVFDIPAFVVAHGDDTAGAVLVKSSTLDGWAKLYQRSYDLLEDTRRWDVFVEGAEADVDASIAKQRKFDSDVWVIEVEDRAGRTLLGEQGLT
ncbi:DUF1491 family protein [Planktotalea arctica]|uniref:DUF1491 family protein n=1 Tax=Planktotalea arctica TaxID=1481893 RepID=UPI000A171C58|nr:DUF1491 family protein [Planktotalea arctica]